MLGKEVMKLITCLASIASSNCFRMWPFGESFSTWRISLSFSHSVRKTALRILLFLSISAFNWSFQSVLQNGPVVMSHREGLLRIPFSRWPLPMQKAHGRLKELSASVDKGAIHKQEHPGLWLTLEHQGAGQNPHCPLSFVPPSGEK